MSETDDLKTQAADLLRRLSNLGYEDDHRLAKTLVLKLRNAREYELMGRLAEVVRRHDPDDATNRRLYGQYLIETGQTTAAIDVLQPLVQRLPKGHPERAEAAGLIGRAYKQIFIEAGDKTSAGARHALAKAIDAYRGPYEESARNTWHGVNLIALTTRAKRLGVRLARGLDPRTIATRVVAELEATPTAQRDEWFLPTLAEASLGLGDWTKVETIIHAYADLSRPTPAFLLASTLRQFTEVWDLQHVDARGRDLVSILRARLACTTGGDLVMSPDVVRTLQTQDHPEEEQLQAILGPKGVESYRWFLTGAQRGLSVAAIRRRLGTLAGTGFLVSSGDVGLDIATELVLVTNFHVINADGAHYALKPDEAEVTFEAMTPRRQFKVKDILWSSPVPQHDTTIVSLDPKPDSTMHPLPLASALPALPPPPAAVLVIGHPVGGGMSGELVYSLRHNDLLDHDGPPSGTPSIAGICRVHYAATTERGSSGSPVFDEKFWEVVALHHSGSKTGMPRLNGRPGLYGANEGISMRSIIAAPK